MTRKRFAVLIVSTHLAAAMLHGAAHGALAVPLRGVGDAVLVAAAVYVGPLAALVGLMLGRIRLGGLLLSTSMAGALAYGIVFHYLLPTPDRVALVPHGAWGEAFGATAALIAVLEAAGVVAGVLLLAGGQAETAGGGGRSAGQAPRRELRTSRPSS